METLNKPVFEHDCDCCSFLGHHDGHDLYYHHDDSMPTVIARYGMYGNYTSGLAFSKTDRHLREAADRAINKGLMTKETWRKWVYRGSGYIPYSVAKNLYMMSMEELFQLASKRSWESDSDYKMARIAVEVYFKRKEKGE